MSGRYRYVVGSLIFAAGAINYMDRAALGIVAPVLRTELHLSHSQLGIIFSGFFVGFAVFSFLGGQLADRFGPTRVLSWAMGGWSLMCGLTCVISGFMSLFTTRAIFGCAEGPLNSTCNRTIVNWFPRHETGRIVGIVWAGHTFGETVAGPIVGLLTVAYGWRPAFIIIAVIGFCWIGLWRLLATDSPARNRRVSREETLMIQESRATLAPVEKADDGAPLRTYLTRPGILAVAAGLFAVNYTLFVFLNWLPSYFTDALHLNMKSMSILSSIPWAAAAIGALGGGMASDVLFKRMSNAATARKLAVVVPLSLVGLSLVVFSFVANVALSVTMAALLLFCNSWAGQGVWSLMHELVPSGHLGGVSGYIHFLSLISGIIGPAATGLIVQHLGGYRGAFWLAATVSVIGVLSMVIFSRTRVRSDLSAGASAT